MAHLILPSRRIVQPQGAVGIDWRNPLTQGFCAAAIPNGNIVRVLSPYTCDAFGVPSGTAIKNEYGTQGLGVSGRQSSINSLRLHSVANASTAWERPVAKGTWLALVVRYGNQPNGHAPVFGNQSPATSPYSAWATVDLNGTGALSVECSAGGTFRGANGAPGSFINNTPLVIVGRYNGSVLQGFANGRQFASVACSGSLVYPNVSDRGPALCNYYNYSGAARSFNGHVYLAALFDRALADAEVELLSANPWQIFAPANRPLFFDLGAGGATHNVLASSSQQANACSAGSIQQTHLTLTANGTQSNVSSTGSVNQTHLIGAANSAQSNVASDGAVSQTSITFVAGSNSAQANQASTASVIQTHLIGVTSSAQSNQVATVDVRQTHLLGAADSAQANATTPGSIALDNMTYVAGSNSAQANQSIAGSIVQTHLIVATPVAVDHVASASSIVQTHLVGAASSQQLNSASSALAGENLPTVGRPSSDVSGTWLASTGTDKYAMVDEVTMDNADYIYTNTVGAKQRMTLNPMADPGSQGQVFSYSVWSPTGHGITVRLLNRSDDSVIAEWIHPGPLSTTAPATENDATHQILTPTQIAAIIDYAAIDLEVESTT